MDERDEESMYWPFGVNWACELRVRAMAGADGTDDDGERREMRRGRGCQ